MEVTDEREPNWREQYITRLMQCGGLTRGEAADCYEAARGMHDFEFEPEDAADEELSYWTNDE
jgi:hypothetical protein